MKEKIINGLYSQFMSSCRMLRDAIKNVSNEKWHEGTKGWFFSLTAYHAVETIDFYIGDSPGKATWGQQAGFDWDQLRVAKTATAKLTKEIVIAYLDETEKKLKDLFDSLDIEKLNSKDEFSWFPSIFEKLVYLLRHNMHHTGELAKTLRDWECKRVEWT
jgi:uncharacterized damage-inducible protein DinB